MIRAKVAKIVSEDELVINKGEFDGVEPGMIFAVKDERLEDIVDPDTGEDLGSIDRPKIFIVMTRIGERAALGKRYEPSNLRSLLGGGFQAYRPRGILSSEDWDERVEIGDVAVWEGERAPRAL